MTTSTERPGTLPVQELERVTIRFVGDSGDGMQLTGTQFTRTAAAFGNDISTFPDYPAEICSVYESRRDALVDGLARAGGFPPPPVTVVREIDLYRLLRAAEGACSGTGRPPRAQCPSIAAGTEARGD